MNRRVQIVALNKSAPQSAEPVKSGRFDRVKLFLGGLLVAAVAFAIGLFAVVVSSFLAAILGIGLLIAVVGLIFKATLRRAAR